jgi:protein subunit release factor B
MKKNKTKLFSVTADDCTWQVFRGSGDGGQKRQKTSSGVRCYHPPSEAEGKATDNRMQSQNRKTAFERMVASKEFQSWLNLKIEAAKGNVEIEETNEHGNKTTRPLRVDEV